MKNTQLVSQRFVELETQLNAIPITHRERGMSTAETAAWRQWSTSALNLLSAASGESSAHYSNFKSLYDHARGYESEIKALGGVFLAAKTDFEGGYIFKLEATISGEIFGDFVTLAKHSLKEGNKDVAAVLACAALEDVLKRYAASNGCSVDDKVMQEVVGALKSKGLVSGAQKSLLEAMPKIRALVAARPRH